MADPVACKTAAARLAKAGLNPSPEAPKETLLRRLTLDITGLPPTLQEIDSFVNDRSPNAYEKVGVFDIDWRNRIPDNARFEFNYKTGQISLTIADLTLSDRETGTSGAYSLADFVPGMIAAGWAIYDLLWKFCKKEN